MLEGHPTLVVGDEEYLLAPGDCTGFRAGTGMAHQLINKSDAVAAYIEVGDRTPGERSEFPNDDIKAKSAADGSWVFVHKDGQPY